MLATLRAVLNLVRQAHSHSIWLQLDRDLQIICTKQPEHHSHMGANRHHYSFPRQRQWLVTHGAHDKSTGSDSSRRRV